MNSPFSLGKPDTFLSLSYRHGKRLNSFFFALKVNIMSVLVTILCRELLTPKGHYVLLCLRFNHFLVNAQQLNT